MRWYTRDWQRGRTADSYDPVAEYVTYLATVREQIPADAYEFASSPRRHLAVDDAKLDLLEMEAGGRILLRLLNGDLPTGYGKLEIQFEGASVVGASIEELRPLLENPATEFLVHEVELVEGQLAVRFLLWPAGEFEIRCRSLKATWHSIADQTRSDFAHQVIAPARCGR